MFMKDISQSDSKVTAATGTAQLQMAGRLCGTSSQQDLSSCVAGLAASNRKFHTGLMRRERKSPL